MENLKKIHQPAKKSIFFLLLAVIFILTSIIYERGVHKRISPEHVAEKFQEAFLQADDLIISISDSIAKPKYFRWLFF